VLFGQPNIEPYWGRTLDLQPGFDLVPVDDFRAVVESASGEARDALDRFDWTTADAHDANEYNSGEDLELTYGAIVKDGAVYGYAATSQAADDQTLRDDAMICDRRGAWLTDAL